MNKIRSSLTKLLIEIAFCFGGHEKNWNFKVHQTNKNVLKKNLAQGSGCTKRHLGHWVANQT